MLVDILTDIWYLYCLRPVAGSTNFFGMNRSTDDLLPDLFDALAFAAVQHQYLRRGGYDRLPYINHLIKVTETLIRIGGERDRDLLLAAVLHDIVEDTEVTKKELASRYGEKVAGIVEELTDDMSLPRTERKARQVAGAPALSEEARKIRIIDKGSNIRDIFTYPLAWTEERKKEYVDQAEAVVDRIRGTSPALEAWFDEQADWARARMGQEERS